MRFSFANRTAFSKCIKLTASLVIAFGVSGCASDGSKKLSVSNLLVEPEIREAPRDTSKNVKENTVVPLADGPTALAAWRTSIQGAKRSIELKTFILRPDDTGMMIAGDLIQAADRGVRVRLLVDDLFHHFKGNDVGFLNAHENIELKIFNPLNRMLPGPISFLASYDRVNPRMHSKALIVDGKTAIVGGRNIASEYFRRNRKAYFLDFELLVTGKSVPELSHAFEEYWSDRYAIHYGKLPDAKSSRLPDGKPPETREVVSRRATDLSVQNFARASRPPVFVATGYVVFDPVSKMRAHPVVRDYVVGQRVFGAVAKARKSVLIVTPYFIPEKYLAELLLLLSRKGIKVEVLTNSLASTNHPSTHAGYLRSRARLLRGGVKIYEYRSHVRHQYSNGAETLSPKTTLHGKVILIDGETTIVGSLNLDPRSVRTNSELVFVAKSSELASWVRRRLEKLIKEQAYSLSLDANGRTTWQYETPVGQAVRKSEPAGQLSHGLVSAIFALLPLDSAL